MTLAGAAAVAPAQTARVHLPLAMRSGLLPARDAVLARVVDRTTAMTGTINTWDWEGGIAMVGLMRAYEATLDREVIDHVQGWVDSRLAEGTPIDDPRFSDPRCGTAEWPAAFVRHPNHAAPTWAVSMLAEHRPKPEYRAVVDATIDFVANRACRVDGALAHAPGQLWDDTLAMTVPLLAREGTRAGRPELLELAVDEVLIHAAHLEDPVTGAWFHGYSFDSGDHMSGARWARGNGWAAVATVELLRLLPASHPRRGQVARVLDRQLRGLAAHQDSSGFWHTVIDRRDFYVETSGTAAIGAALLAAPSLDDWTGADLRWHGDRARAAAYAAVAADGTVTGVSSGTGVAPTIDQYGRVPNDRIKPYGQALWLIMATAGGQIPRTTPDTAGSR